MKTTMDIADDLLRRARRMARQQNITLKTLAEEGLRLAIERRQRKRSVGIKPHVVTGKAMPADLSWDRLRETLYGEEGRSLRG